VHYLGITSNDNALNKCGPVVYWLNLGQNKDKWRDLAKTVKKHSDSIKIEHRDNRGKISLSIVNILSGVSSLVGHTIAQKKLALGYGSDGPSLESGQEQKISLFSRTSRKSLGPTQPPIQRKWAFFSGV